MAVTNNNKLTIDGDEIKLSVKDFRGNTMQHVIIVPNNINKGNFALLDEKSLFLIAHIKSFIISKISFLKYTKIATNVPK